MRPIAIKDYDSGYMVPIGDLEEWFYMRQVGSKAEFLNHCVLRYVSIADARAAGIWKPEYDTMPDVIDEEDMRGIISNEDRTR